jgi:hypothetical protein
MHNPQWRSATYAILLAAVQRAFNRLHLLLCSVRCYGVNDTLNSMASTRGSPGESVY